MTDLIEKIAKAIDPSVWKEGAPIPTREETIEFHTRRRSSAKLAGAALSVIKENAGDLVRPLVWKELESGALVSGKYMIVHQRGNKYQVKVGKGKFSSIQNGMEKSKQWAQLHHTARVLSLLNLEVE